ncbi:MAG: GNAT family N-acetyltransferase [Spirochaetales bacterium]|nr:GNAT family N-acetyltransferase [Spirochaetales bacterium]
MDGILETKRLYLRELVPEDRDELAKVLCDSESMRFYPAPFNIDKVENWISWNMGNYKELNHGLWVQCDQREPDLRCSTIDELSLISGRTGADLHLP